MSANAVNAASGAAKMLRPTLMFIGIGLFTIIVNSIAISKIPKKEKKGAGYAMIVLSLVGAIFLTLWNMWTYGKETGMAAAAKAQGQSLFTKFQQKISGGGAPGATNVGGAGTSVV